MDQQSALPKFTFTRSSGPRLYKPGRHMLVIERATGEPWDAIVTHSAHTTKGTAVVFSLSEKPWEGEFDAGNEQYEIVQQSDGLSELDEINQRFGGR